MRRSGTIALLLLVASAFALGQSLTVIGEHNAYLTKKNSTLPDTLKPYFSDQGVRTVWGDDIDKDGKTELFATDYSNGGRVHMFKMTAPNKMELVWSSKKLYTGNANSVPRWIQFGDLDGDGNREVIFPLGTRYVGEIDVYEWDGASLGTEPALTMPTDQFVSSGMLRQRLDRETGTVYDFDGDGRSEFIGCNEDGKVYIFGVNGEFPGFGAWQIEGGDPAVVTENKFSAGSWWHSLPVDIDGDGKKEIVNHYWNFYGFWSIDVVGPDTYRYPRPVAEGKTTHYIEFLKNQGADACAYMGVVPADVDGDKKQEIAGVLYIGGSPLDYQISLVSVAKGDTGVYVWKDTTQFGLIGTNLWTLAGKTGGSHWGMSAYDFNGNGKDELLIGGSADYNLISLEYKGSGSIMSEASYDKKIIYPGDKARYHFLDIYDSLGVKRDTVFRESPFLSKVFAPTDMDGDGKKEVALAYQSIADSITYTYYHFDTTGVTKIFKQDSVRKTLNTSVIDIRVLEYSTTGFKPLDLTFIGPDDYQLAQNYPNPFNPSTTIRFSLPVDKKISLVVYDVLGKEVRTLIGDQLYKEGSHQVTWDGTNNQGRPVASGSYVYTLKFGNFSKSAKMTLLK